MLSANAWHSRSACLTTVTGTAICCYPQAANSLLPQFALQFLLAGLSRPVAVSRRKWDTSLVTDGSPGLDITVPHSARVWNYWLGGEDNYAADRLVGDQVMAMFPDPSRS